MKRANMDPNQMAFILILFYLMNVISGASIRNVELFNETLDAGEELRTVLQNIQKNYYTDELENYKMEDIEDFLTGFSNPAKKEKPIHVSKTFFGAHEGSNDNAQHQAWNPFRANRFIGSQPSYFDVPDIYFQQYIDGKINHEGSYSKASNVKVHDFPHGLENEPEDSFSFSKIISSEDQAKEFSHSIDGDTPENTLHDISRPIYYDDPRDLLHDGSLPTHYDAPRDLLHDVSYSIGNVKDQVDNGSLFQEVDFDLKNLIMNEVTTEVVNQLLQHIIEEDNEFEEIGDSSAGDRDFFFESLDGNVKMTDSSEILDELISEDDVDGSQFFRLGDSNNSEVLKDVSSFNMSNANDPFVTSRNESHTLYIDGQNVNKSYFTQIKDEHLDEVQSNVDYDPFEFVGQNDFNVPIMVEDPMLDKDEFQGSGDVESFEVPLANAKLESKSGRIIDFFPRVNNTAECTTPKGERGQCLSLTQCPLSEPLNNFNLFLQYVCLSKGVLVGICCPDNPVVEISDSADNSTLTPVTELKQPIDGCGLSSNTRIVGGKISLPHEWTWMVALMRRNRFFCGGVIINDWYILTAAHCVMGIKVKDLKVRLGEYSFNEKNEHQQDIPVAEIKRHALFVTLTFQHDIALLKLKRRIEYTKFIGSICLPNPKSGNFSNVNATVVGWGTEAFGGTASPVLRQVTIPVWDNDECDKTYRLERITNAFMCAGSPENGEDACQGDSGGPLMTLEEGRWEVIGIVSWGRRCGDPTFPGVYTRVTSYLEWIAENAN